MKPKQHSMQCTVYALASGCGYWVGNCACENTLKVTKFIGIKLWVKFLENVFVDRISHWDDLHMQKKCTK